MSVGVVAAVGRFSAGRGSDLRHESGDGGGK